YTTKNLPEKLKNYGYNIQIEMRSMGTHDPNEWDQKFQLEIASGAKPPDITQLGGPSQAAVKAGWFAEISEAMIQKYIPRYYKQVNDIYEKTWAYGKDVATGKMYGVPSFNMFGPNRHTVAYREDWLKKFNMEPPATIGEFEVWLQKCRTLDPNGNGQNDEYGYTSQDDVPFFSEVFGAFGFMPQQWTVRDNKVVRGDILPEMKDALRILRNWYAKDLIPKGILTTAKRDQDFYSGLIGTMGQAGGYAPAIVPSGSYFAALTAQNPGASIIGAPSFKGPKGHFGTWEWGPRKYLLYFGSHLKEEEIGRIMQMFETIASNKDLFELTMLGERGLHWEFTNSSANSGSTVFLAPYTEHNKKLTEVGVREMSESAWCPIWLSDVYNNYLDPLAVKYANQNPGYYDAMLTLPTASSPLYLEDCNRLTRAYSLDVITGKKDLDATFDAFVRQWFQQGGEILTKEANEMYDLMFR
ncbi:MAG: extracellular solute-binding protein, partial [Treponema sp.]|nr:extracellular solute-binding protein [Treponema sp.]